MSISGERERERELGEKGKSVTFLKGARQVFQDIEKLIRLVWENYLQKSAKLFSRRERDVSISGERDMDETEDIFEEVLIS